MSFPVDTIVGFINGKALYVVTISANAYRRVRDLSAAGALHADWMEDGIAVGYVRIKTTNPQALVDIERAVAGAR